MKISFETVTVERRNDYVIKPHFFKKGTRHERFFENA